MIRKESKKFTLLLGLTVIGIWGVFIYRLYDHKKEETVVIEQNSTLEDSKLLLERRVQYSVKEYNNDPFFEKKTVRHSAKVVTKKTPLAVSWPSVEYLGQLSSNKGKRHLFHIKQKTVVWEIGQEYEGMRLEEQKDQLIIRYQNETKMIHKKGSDEK